MMGKNRALAVRICRTEQGPPRRRWCRNWTGRARRGEDEGAAGAVPLGKNRSGGRRARLAALASAGDGGWDGGSGVRGRGGRAADGRPARGEARR